jgi:hypothetical protein
VSIVERVAETASDPRKVFSFARSDRDALVLLRTIMNFDMPTGCPPTVEQPWLPLVDHILRFL